MPYKTASAEICLKQNLPVFPSKVSRLENMSKKGLEYWRNYKMDFLAQILVALHKTIFPIIAGMMWFPYSLSMGQLPSMAQMLQALPTC